MSSLSDFDLDLSVGHEGENLVQAVLTGTKTVEVKKDLRWKDTGNLYIENLCWSHNQNCWYPSGLSSTKAEYWAFVLEKGIIVVPTEILKKVVLVRGRAIECKIKPNFSKGHLITPEDILDALKAL